MKLFKPKTVGDPSHNLAIIAKCDYCGGMEIHKADHVGPPQIYHSIQISDKIYDPPIEISICSPCLVKVLNKALGKPHR